MLVVLPSISCLSVPSVVQDLPCCCSPCLMDRQSSTPETSEPIPRWRPTPSYSAAGCRRSTWTPRQYSQLCDLFGRLPQIRVFSGSVDQYWLTHVWISDVSHFYLSSYCSPEYTFPRQQEVINFAASTAFELVTLNPRTLVVCGSYSVGKEKVFLGECSVEIILSVSA